MKILLPLFPLNLVAFPGEQLNLHIFEPRYRQLVNECYENNKTFGIPPVKEGQPLLLGTEMKIVEISKAYEDGKLDIKTVGLNAFKLLDFKTKAPDKLYPIGEVSLIEDDPASDIVLAGRVLKLIRELYEIMRMKNEVPELSNDFQINSIAHKIGLNFDQEIELLQINSEEERLSYVESHLLRLIPIVGEMELLRKKVQMNGHFKNVIPPDLREIDPE